MLDHLNQIAHVFKQFREEAGLSQEQLAQQCGPELSRSTIALFEQGRRTPAPPLFNKMAQVLGIPMSIWEPFSREESRHRQEFESALGELVGFTVTLKMMHIESVEAAEKQIQELFSAQLTFSQAFDAINSILVYYGIRKINARFFGHYFSQADFQSLQAFEHAISVYQSDAIRLFSTFREAYRCMNREGTDLHAILAPLTPRDISAYRERTTWNAVTPIEEERLPYLGYISVARYRSQRQKRQVLARYLRELAGAVRQEGAIAVENMPESRRRKMDSLLRELDSTLQHTPISPLFAPNPAELEAEAARILREEQDEEEMARTQSEALANLSSYISADHLDIYVATSMRTESDFVSVNRFVHNLFRHPRIAPLNLRYFNPTQSWIEDRVAKGLVEALMLRRASYHIYMAQKSDTFGKDSEASVALGQGKPVLVYVPKLRAPGAGIDSETLHSQPDSYLRQLVQQDDAGRDQEEYDTLDHSGLYAEALSLQLSRVSDEHLAGLVRDHWADFGLLDESERIRGAQETARREAYTQWLKQVIAQGLQTPAIPPGVREDITKILVALTVNFEKRAQVFREIHPLALQVILSSGVLNGILVARSVESCAHLLKALIENQLDLELRIEPENYRLIETSTQSTIRVISRNNLLINAFDAFYERL